MEENKKSFLEELQSLEEATKKKVVVVATAVLMVGVVYLWLGYFNGLVAGNQTQSENAAQAPSVMATIENDFSGAIHWIVGAFKAPGQYVIHPQQQ